MMTGHSLEKRGVFKWKIFFLQGDCLRDSKRGENPQNSLGSGIDPIEVAENLEGLMLGVWH